ncbi:NUDIX hydrolase [Shewanella frigidimarina]|uniref:Phosphatase NudJ n=1 Tax=Shewanella frigidimarina (strain NCIMB 400) TaxID=318167 RepID=Q081G0_SHEFN|nr:NUDIX hydrolase [Shewanella frigidimarina]ABI72105.1 NUDIX hydrolase [Shewanella frigidimarina NCIMB 400]
MTERYKPNTTVACVIHCQGKFLLVEECINGAVKFNQPAGHLEANESIIEACAREIVEETGLELTPQALVGIYQFRAAADLAFVRYTFCIELAKQQHATPRDNAITAIHWLNLADITALGNQLRSPLVLKSIEDFLQQSDKNHPAQHTPLSLLNVDYF